MTPTFGRHIVANTEAHVAVVTIDRPPYNHVSVEFIRDLAGAFETIDAREEIRCSVLQAAGKHFCAGADLVSPDGVGATGMIGVDSLYREAARLFAAQKPIVAAVQGGAIGAGLGLAVMADFRIASPEARFSANFVKLGFHPGFGLTHTLPRLIGHSKAELMCLTGRRVRAEEALRWGLVDEVVPLEELRSAALRLANEIAENAPLAIAATRRTLRGDLAEVVRLQMEHEYLEQASLRPTEDFREGVRAVAERRPGRFVGR
jgi:enoyl-CoA hydratase/carnithine racemase